MAQTVDDFMYDLEAKVKQFARANDDDTNMVLLQRIAGLLKYYDSSLVKEDGQLKEAITLDVKVGDTILTGKFRNKKTVVKDIGKDDHGMPTINGRKITTFRYTKEEDLNEARSFEELKAAAKEAPSYKAFQRTITPEERKILRQRSKEKYGETQPKPGPREALEILNKNKEAIKALYDKFKPMGFKGTSGLQRELEKLLYPQAEKLGLSSEETRDVKDMINYGLGSISLGKVRDGISKQLHLNETK